MCGPPKRSLIPATLALSLSPLLAWAPETRVRMVDEAIRLMPASLHQALASHREQLLAGALRPLAGEDEPGHRPPWAAGRLDSELAAVAGELAATLARPVPFGEVAERFGSLAHYVSDAGFPPGVGEEASDRRYRHFAEFCESRRERFPVVFYGHEDPRLARGDYGAFALEVMRLASHDDGELARAYAAAGDPPDPAAFDDRSVPFAIGSLAYSRSITNIVRAWLSVWQSAEGDMSRTPYRTPAEAEADPRRE